MVIHRKIKEEKKKKKKPGGINDIYRNMAADSIALRQRKSVISRSARQAAWRRHISLLENVAWRHAGVCIENMAYSKPGGGSYLVSKRKSYGGVAWRAYRSCMRDIV